MAASAGCIGVVLIGFGIMTSVPAAAAHVACLKSKGVKQSTLKGSSTRSNPDGTGATASNPKPVKEMKEIGSDSINPTSERS